MTPSGSVVFCLDADRCDDVARLHGMAVANRFGFAAIPLRKTPQASSTEHAPCSSSRSSSGGSVSWTHSDLALESGQWAAIIGKVSQWGELSAVAVAVAPCSSGQTQDNNRSIGRDRDRDRDRSNRDHRCDGLVEDAVFEQFEWALHVGMKDVVLPPLPLPLPASRDGMEDRGRGDVPTVEAFARIALRLASRQFLQQRLLVPVPLGLPHEQELEADAEAGAETGREAGAVAGGSLDGLAAWNRFTQLTGHHGRLLALLDMGGAGVRGVLQKEVEAERSRRRRRQREGQDARDGEGEGGEAMDAEEAAVVSAAAFNSIRRCTERWGAEHIGGIVIPTELFVQNKAGFPVLYREHQIMLAVLLKYTPFVVIKGEPVLGSADVVEPYLPYMQYVQHIQHNVNGILMSTCTAATAAAASSFAAAAADESPSTTILANAYAASGTTGRGSSGSMGVSLGAKMGVPICTSASGATKGKTAARTSVLEAAGEVVKRRRTDADASSSPSVSPLPLSAVDAAPSSSTLALGLEQLSYSEAFTASYRDTLQLPLQPLADNLESCTYETFERDATKYAAYEEAIAAALVAVGAQRREAAQKRGCFYSRYGSDAQLRPCQCSCAVCCDDSFDWTVQVPVRVAVVGAGRGPLVGAALRAAAATQTKCEVFAVEKNRNAVRTLRGRKVEEADAWSSVTVVGPCDLREWVPPPLSAAPTTAGRYSSNSGGLMQELDEDFGDAPAPVAPQPDQSACQCPCRLLPYTSAASTHSLAPSPYVGLNTVDVLVSELLGSWGDNELSPECLDHCVSRCLRQGQGQTRPPGTARPSPHQWSYGGICIPESYSSFLAPLSSSRLWMNARDIVPPNATTAAAKGLDIPYVVKLYHCHYLSAAVLPVCHFSHHAPAPPPPSTATAAATDGPLPVVPAQLTDIFDNRCNRRHVQCSFPPLEARLDGMTLHGFAGTFETTLFTAPPGEGAGLGAGEGHAIKLSIRPDSHTVGMFSWFPLFLPLGQPVILRTGDVVSVQVWRCVDGQKVWYEWCLSGPVATPIQNSNASSYSIALR